MGTKKDKRQMENEKRKKIKDERAASIPFGYLAMKIIPKNIECGGLIPITLHL